jgi:hypothetical protein
VFGDRSAGTASPSRSPVDVTVEVIDPPTKRSTAL